MAGFSNYLRAKVLGTFVGADLTFFPETWVNLLTTLPTNDGPVGGGDSWGGLVESLLPRVRVWSMASGGTPHWLSSAGAFSGWELKNNGAVGWSETDTAAFVTATMVGVGIFDSGTPGASNVLMHDALVFDKVITASTAWSFPTGNLVVRMHGETI